jgi:plastocyanin
MDRRTFLAGVSGVGSVALAGCNALRDGSANAEETDYDVGMGGSFFRPTEIEIAAGESVVWRNTGNRRHTVTAYENRIPEAAEYFASGGFDSEEAARESWRDGFGGAIDSTETYEHTFEVSGEYHYLCIPHEPSGMVGTVVVTE